MTDLDKQADEQAQKVLAVLADYRKTINSAEDKQLTDKVESLLNEYRSVCKQMRKLGLERRKDEAVALMNDRKITCLFAVRPDGDGRAEGILHIHDCLRAGVV